MPEGLTTEADEISSSMYMSTPSIAQLQRAVQISEQIEKLELELKSLLSGIDVGNGVVDNQPKAKRRGRPRKTETVVGEQSLGIETGDGKKKRKMSVAGRAKIAAAQKARWAKVKGDKTEAVAGEPKAKKKKRKMTPEARARIVAAVKARWAKEKGTK